MAIRYTRRVGARFNYWLNLLDKLRALRYFVAAAETRSLSGAARREGVSVAAVSKLIGALEESLGSRLFERHARGLELTASGVAYLDGCVPALAQLTEADQLVSSATSRASGTVVIGTQPTITQECLTPALPRFNALYPDIQLDIRLVQQPTGAAARGIDVFLLLGWPQASDFVHRRIGASGFVVCASPGYWSRHGMPRHPSELQHHNCLTLRNASGTLMDLWTFKRADERAAVTVRGWLLADNAHRDVVRDMALAGGGVARLLDWHKRRGQALASGALIAALADWDAVDVPPVNLLYPPSSRRVERVRVVIEFLTQLFRDIEQQRDRQTPSTVRPEWLRNNPARASATLRRR